MKKSTKNILKYFVFLILAVMLMYFAFRAIDFNNFVNGLRSANYWLIALSIFIGVVGYLFRALRWKILIDTLDYNPPIKNVWHAIMIGYLANFTIPRIGEIIRCTVLKKTDNLEFGKTFGTVIVERCYDMLFLLIFLVVIILARFEMFGKFISEKIYNPLAAKLSSISNLSIIAIVAIAVIAIALLIIWRKRSKKNAGESKIKKIVNGLISGIKTGISMKKRGLFFLYTILIYLCYWLTGFLVLKAVPVTQSLGAIDALFLFVLGAFGWVIPAQGGFGSYHILMAWGLMIFGVSYDDGIVVATISHESQVIFMILLGLISLCFFAFAPKNIKQTKK